MPRKVLTISPTTGDLQQLPEDDTIQGVDYAFVHDQAAPLATWTVNHNLGRYPSSILVVTSAGDIVWTDVVLTSLNVIQIVADSAFSGKVYLR